MNHVRTWNMANVLQPSGARMLRASSSLRAARMVRAWATSMFVLASLMIAAPAMADPPGRVGRISESYGAVWLADDQRGEWIAATRNRPVTTGDRLSLQPGARAVVHIGSATLRLDGDSELEVVQLDDRHVRMYLHAGSAALQLPSGDSAREFEISTVDGRVSAPQRAHFRVDRNNNTSIVTAWDGNLHFESSDSSLDITQGQRAELWQDGGRTHYSWGRVDRDEFTDWVVTSERRAGGGVAQRYVSPEMTGAEELNRYGQWDQHPQYGAVWYPRSVASDWAPYRDGQWTWVSPWGWTWVDNAPWGFAPFHYGRWVQWRGRWVWTPGSYVARPTYAPALVAWFGGPNLTVSISSGAHVGWVPLAPFEVFSPWYVASAVYASHINVSPWRHVSGYHGHRYNDYANRGHHGGFTVVPQRVLTERHPIRQDVITPQQAAVWRGGAVVGGGAVVVPPRTGRESAPGQPGRINDRVAAVFVPPAPPTLGARAVAPAQPPGTSRAVPWVRHAAQNQTAGVLTAPAVTTRDGIVVSNPSVEVPPRVDGQAAPRGAPARGDDRAAVLGGVPQGNPSRPAEVFNPRRMEPPIVGERRDDGRWNNGPAVSRGAKPPLESTPQGAPGPQVMQPRPMPAPAVASPTPSAAPPVFEQRPSRANPASRERDMPAVMPAPPQVQRPMPQPMPPQPTQQVMVPRPAQPIPQVQPPTQPGQPQAQPGRPQRGNIDDDDRGPRRGNPNDQRVR